MNKLIIIWCLLIGTELCHAQNAYFGTRGTISFDKITYNRARMRSVVNQAPTTGQGNRPGGFGMDVNNIPESSTQKVTLQFDENHSLLTLDEDPSAQNNNQRRASNFSGGAGRGNMGGNRNSGGGMPRANIRNPNKVLYQDLKKQTAEIQVEIDENYLLTDSLTEITWRFTDEYRNIAGFECRRVNGATKDSLYLIAYYTDQIPVSAGPALSHGLPGMILGLVIPEMHIHYWATFVNYNNEPVSSSNWKEKKNKGMTLNEFSEAFGRFFQRRDTNDSNKRRILEQLIY